MVRSSEQIDRHALEKAYRELTAELEKGIEQFRNTLGYSSGHEVCECIERFVDTLGSRGLAELRRRAGLIAALCGPNSTYHAGRAHALELTPTNFVSDFPPWLKRPTESLLNSGAAPDAIAPGARRPPLFLSEVSGERKIIETLLNHENLNLSETARQAYQEWRNSCRTVEKEARLLEVDGCWYLYNIHQAGENQPASTAEFAKLWTQTDVGAANLAEIKAAADSMVAWLSMGENPGHETPAGNRDENEILSVADDPIQYVTLDQAAAMVSRSKRTLERYKNQMPEPSVRGGGKGKPDEWDWAILRPWLEGQFDRKLPERFLNRLG